jgi:hypothetical protein
LSQNCNNTVCEQASLVVPGFPSKAPHAKAANLATFATFADFGVLNFQLVDLNDFGGLTCTAIGDVQRNSMFSFRSGKALL